MIIGKAILDEVSGQAKGLHIYGITFFRVGVKPVICCKELK